MAPLLAIVNWLDPSYFHCYGSSSDLASFPKMDDVARWEKNCKAVYVDDYGGQSGMKPKCGF